MFDMMNMLGKMKEVQAKMKEAQDKIRELRIEGEAGAGMVKVIVSGDKRIIKIDIDDSIIKPEDKGIIQDLVVAAVNNAMDNVEVVAKETIKDSTNGLLPNIPGLDFGGFGH
jgi:nucleoid-associated protein EbfC